MNTCELGAKNAFMVSCFCGATLFCGHKVGGGGIIERLPDIDDDTIVVTMENLIANGVLPQPVYLRSFYRAIYKTLGQMKPFTPRFVLLMNELQAILAAYEYIKQSTNFLGGELIHPTLRSLEPTPLLFGADKTFKIIIRVINDVAVEHAVELKHTGTSFFSGLVVSPQDLDVTLFYSNEQKQAIIESLRVRGFLL